MLSMFLTRFSEGSSGVLGLRGSGKMLLGDCELDLRYPGRPDTTYSTLIHNGMFISLACQSRRCCDLGVRTYNTKSRLGRKPPK